MRIVNSFMDDLPIRKGKLHTVSFESSYIQSKFRDLLLAYFQRKTQSDCDYLHILNEKREEVHGKDFYFVSFDCNVINLREEKSTTQLLQKLLFHHLENNPELIQEYMEFNEHINEFTSHIEMESDNMVIDFRPTEKTITQFIKSLQIYVEYNENHYVPNYIMRRFLIQSILKMNLTEKEVFLLISFPETDIGCRDYKEFIEILKQLQVTTLIITTQHDFLTSAEKENMFLVDKDGGLYDILELYQELLAFGLADKSESSLIAKTLAFKDFKKNYFLLDGELKEFLQSNKF